MFTLHMKYRLYALLFLGGLVCLAFASYQQHYSQLITTGHREVAEQRFDSQDYERAGRFWFASQDRLTFNRGVLAYKAQNLPRAAQYFRQVSQDTTSPTLRVQALHNLGMVMVALKKGQGAAQMFKEALRLNPEDMRSKFHLERLYHFVLALRDNHPKPRSNRRLAQHLPKLFSRVKRERDAEKNIPVFNRLLGDRHALCTPWCSLVFVVMSVARAFSHLRKAPLYCLPTTARRAKLVATHTISYALATSPMAAGFPASLAGSEPGRGASGAPYVDGGIVFKSRCP